MLHIILPILLIAGLTGLIIVIIIILIILTWYFFFNDRNVILGFYEYLGRGVGRFSGKVVWLVGASSSLGESLAVELAIYGAKLILSGKSADVLQKVKANCIAKSKGKLTKADICVLPFDATKMDEKYIQNAISQFGKIDVFINNMGYIELGEASKMSIESDKALFNVTFFTPVFLIKHMVNLFKEMGGGQIITISSPSGKFGIPGQASAAASQQALHGFLDSLRLECIKYKIYITVVYSGLIRSSITDQSILLGNNSEIRPEELEKMCRKGLTTKRCAHLALVSGVNYCYESWVSNQPFLFLIAVAQYFPRIHKYMMYFRYSAKNLRKTYAGKSPNTWCWRPLFVI